jgi:RNA polymerase sigma-70 factor (ECF subfamily)
LQEGALERDGGALKPNNLSGKGAGEQNDLTGGSLTEAELIAAAIAGDQDACSAIFQQNKNKVAAAVASILKHSAQAEDVAQDVWLVAFSRLDQFNGSAKLSTWLCRIAINQSLVFLRRQRQASNGTNHLVPIEMESEEGLREWFGAEDPRLKNLPVAMEVQKLLSELTPGDRQVLSLAYLEGLSVDEVAGAMGLSLAGAKSKLWHAKRRARERYGARPGLLSLCF